MFGQQNGLSLDQAPPIRVIFRFFLIASLFGMGGGIWLAVFAGDIMTERSALLALTHIFTLGIMASFMIGALFQMLPVIAGVVIRSPLPKSLVFTLAFVPGTMSLVAVFGGYQEELLYTVAFILLGFALFLLIVIMLPGLLSVTHHTPSSKGMTIALTAFAFTFIPGLYMTGILGGFFDGSNYTIIRAIHYGFGLEGWIALLIVSISFQVIEMFYVTPPYPPLVAKYFTTLVLSLLILKVPLLLYGSESSAAAVDTVIGILLLLFALITLRRLSQRKRSVTDASLWFWRLGMGNLIAVVVSALLLKLGSFGWMLGVLYISFVFFALSIVFAMFYKIVPFLTWFHLNAEGYFSAPMMHEVIAPSNARRHFWLHLVTLTTLLLSFALPALFRLGGILLILSFGVIAWHILSAGKLYEDTKLKGEKFDLGMGMQG